MADDTLNQTADASDEQQNPEVTETTDTRKPSSVRSEGEQQVVFVQPPSYQ